MERMQRTARKIARKKQPQGGEQEWAANISAKHVPPIVKMQSVVGNQGVQRLMQRDGIAVQRLWNPFNKKTASLSTPSATLNAGTQTVDVDPSAVSGGISQMVGMFQTWEKTPLKNLGNTSGSVMKPLHDAKGHKLFTAFIRQELSIENLHMLHALEWLKNNPTFLNAHIVHETFVKPGATYEVNLSSKIRAKAAQQLQTGPIDDSFIHNLLDGTMFNISDTFTRFSVTDSYKKWIAPFDKQAKKDAAQKAALAEAARTKHYGDLKVQKRSIISSAVLSQLGASDSAMTLALRDAESYALFSRFAELDFASEYFIFLETLDSFTSSPNLRMAQNIISLFVESGSSPYELNLPTPIKKPLLDTVNSMDPSNPMQAMSVDFFKPLAIHVSLDMVDVYNRLTGSKDSNETKAEIQEKFNAWLAKKDKAVAKLNKPGFGARVRGLFK